ncbi:phosphoribulokinase [Halothiobacillus sp.]|uniref:phosphoribulokinase n=1 Tax=Halothiobacillus sp. TaxID=1891311 RepID=UPI00260F3E38|nr:phosphoribulokinase [Halothiobacillus sp.]MDD4966034.1 phosphoribulokinase [Halothiobacillus sp.]
MSVKHPVVAVTGSSGAGTTTVKRAFEHVFRRESLTPVVIEGDSFHSLSRVDFREAVKKAEALGNFSFSHFGPEANHFDKLAELFKTYGETGTGKKRYYIHSDQEAAEHNARLNTNLKPGEFTPWEDIPPGSDLLFYEGLHGLVKTDTIDASAHVDLGVGVVPIINLEWIQKIFRDNAERGYSAEATVDTILRRMPDYVKHITPQFSRTDINFQRVPTVDTSNPFITRDIPTPDESLVIIRFSNPKKIGADFPYLLSMIPNSFMSRYNTIVVPGGKMSYAMDLILTPVIHNMIEQRNA